MRRLARAALVAAMVGAALAALTASLFVRPAQGMPSRVDAIVMLDGPGETLSLAERLAAEGRAPFLVISRGTRASRDPCPRPVSGVRLICFNPVPATTRGEAEFVGRLSRRYHWRSIAVVAIAPQVTRARLRVERCFPGRVYMVSARMTKSTWSYQIAYEWASLVKALVIQRSC